MKFLHSFLLAGVLIFSPASGAQDADLIEIDVVELITTFSKTNGTKFVVDPRVMAKIKLVGFKIDELDYETLTRILRVHNFVAIEADGVVYVMPNHDVEETRQYLTN